MMGRDDGRGNPAPLYSASLVNFPQALALQNHPGLRNSSPLASMSMDSGSPQTPKFKDVQVPYMKQQGICIWSKSVLPYI